MRIDRVAGTVTQRGRLRLLAGLALAAIAGTAQAAAPIAVDLVGGRVKGDDTIKVHQGDTVQVRFTSDRPAVLHLHGYEIEVKVTPGAPALMSFKASLAGRFPMHEHREGAGNHRAVLFIEVHP